MLTMQFAAAKNKVGSTSTFYRRKKEQANHISGICARDINKSERRNKTNKNKNKKTSNKKMEVLKF